MTEALAAIAQAQLAAWERYAREWPMRLASRENGWHLVCAVCEQTLLPFTYHDRPYSFTTNQTLGMLVAHLRNVHRWVESEVYQDGNEDQETNHNARTSSVGDSRNTDLG